MIETERLRLRNWSDSDRAVFTEMHADPEVMWDAVRPLTRSDSDAKLSRYVRLRVDHGFSRWAMEDKHGEFLGYVGLLPIPDHRPAGSGVETGWRLCRSAWGKGLATEGARAVLGDGFRRLNLAEVWRTPHPTTSAHKR